MLPAGRLRHRGRIQYDANLNVEANLDADGHPTPDWRNLHPFELPCNVQGVVGGETVRGVQVQATMTHLVELRFREDITSDMRMLWKGRTLNVVFGSDPEGRQERFVLQCRENR